MGNKSYYTNLKALQKNKINVKLNIAKDLNSKRQVVSRLMKTTRDEWLKAEDLSAKTFLDLADVFDEWKTLIKIAERFKTHVKEVEKQNSNSESVMFEMDKQLSDLIGLIGQAERTAKELGVDPKAISGMGEAIDIRDMSIKVKEDVRQDGTRTRSLQSMKNDLKTMGIL